jgi:hypothetical protein
LAGDRKDFGMLRTATALLAAAVAAPALANDTSAELATGGLLFVQNDNVEMRSEDLAISIKEVDVRYRFFNKAASDVTILVAFPMPEVRIEEQDQNISLPTEDAVNLLAFATTVNGKPVKTQVEQHVFAAGIDRTQLLTSLGIPLAPHLAATNQALDALPRDKWDELIRLGLGEIEEYDIGKGMMKHFGRALEPAHHVLLGADLSGQGRDRDRAPLPAECRRLGADLARRAFIRQGSRVRRLQAQILPRQRLLCHRRAPAQGGEERVRSAL